MSIKRSKRYLTSARLRTLALSVIAATFAGLSVPQATAQDPREKLPTSTFSLFSEQQLPGAIGAIQLERNPCLRGYMQPIEFRGPEGVEFSFANDSVFGDFVKSPAGVAMYVGIPYRIKITGIPFQPEAELFPTVEIIDRTYPPAEKAHRFPIPVEFDQLELEAALRGEMVTRVIYLEDSSIAEPVSYVGPQRVYDAQPGEDMMMTADTYGRPLAIIRLGSRVPESPDGFVDSDFLYQSPPVAMLKAVPNAESLYEQGIFQRYEAPKGSSPQASINKIQPDNMVRHADAIQRIGDSH